MLEYNVTNIEWEVDDGYNTDGLPSEANVLIPDTPDINETDIDDYISECLSSEYGCLVNGFQYEMIA